MRCKLKSIVAEALPRDKPYQIHDTELHSLFLRVEPSGSRAYYLEYRNADGRRLRYRIGGFPGADPDQARKLATIAAGDVASGIDIQARKKEQRYDHELCAPADVAGFR